MTRVVRQYRAYGGIRGRRRCWTPDAGCLRITNVHEHEQEVPELVVEFRYSCMACPPAKL